VILVGNPDRLSVGVCCLWGVQRQLLIESTEGQRVTRSRVTQLKSGGPTSGANNRNGSNRSHGGSSRSGGGRRDQRGGGAEQNGRAYPLRERKTVSRLFKTGLIRQK
jgi:hypothetical protein